VPRPPLPRTLQLQYNNELLVQMRSLEERHLAAQKEAVEKQAALRQALGVCEAARQEVTPRRHVAPAPHLAAVSLFIMMLPVCGERLSRDLCWWSGGRRCLGVAPRW
jgi:hypothetical protein